MSPTAEEVRSALETILASRSFASSTRLSRFLRFVVERTLAGDGERLKEYVLGIEVFDRGADYDPRIDSIVRVEAGRVRSKLEEYYGGGGAGAAVRIRMEKGSYAPVFERRPELPAMDGDAPANLVMVAVDSGEPVVVSGLLASGQARAPSAPAHVGSRRLIIASVAAMGLLLALAAIGWRFAAESRTLRTAIAVLPFTASARDAAQDALAAQLTERVTAELVRRAEIMVIASSSARAAAASLRPAHDISRTLDAEFLLQASVRHEAGQVFVEARLVNGARDHKFWVDSFSAGEGELDELARRVAAAAAAAVAAATATI